MDDKIKNLMQSQRMMASPIMTDIRENLKPKGTKNVVRLSINGAGFFDYDFIKACIDEMEMKLIMTPLDTPSKLEILAMELLKDSARNA